MTRTGRRHVKKDTFASVVQQYLNSAKFASLRPATQQNFERNLTLAALPENLGAVSTNDIRPSLVQKYLDKLASRPGKQEITRKALQSVAKWAVLRDILPYAITPGTEVVGSDGGHKPWTDEQIAVAEKYASPAISRFITLGSNTGQRGSDIVRMRWSDIETHNGRLGIRVKQLKTGLELWVPFTNQLEAAVQHWGYRQGDISPIVVKRDGTPISRGDVSTMWWQERHWNEWLAPVKDCTLHGLRATAVQRLRRAGATEGQISKTVGMSIPMITRYCRFSNQVEDALAAVNMLDKNARRTPEN